LSFSPPCSGEGAYKKPPEAASRGVLIKKQTGKLWKQQTAERHLQRKNKRPQTITAKKKGIEQFKIKNHENDSNRKR
jgi:hypothetical protein